MMSGLDASHIVTADIVLLVLIAHISSLSFFFSFFSSLFSDRNDLLREI